MVDQDRSARRRITSDAPADAPADAPVPAVTRERSGQRPAGSAVGDSEHRFRLAFDEAPIGMALVDISATDPGRFLRVNRALAQITGYDQDELVGRGFGLLNPPEAQLEAARALRQLARGERESWEADTLYRRADGGEVWVHVTTAVAREPGGMAAFAISQIMDISGQKATEERLAHLALHDPLTGLPNRALLMDHLVAALKRSDRDHRHLAVLFLDLDDFKTVNDSLGYEAGDEMLQAVARRLGECLRGRDIVARHGGDEFVAVCEELDDPTEVVLVADRIQQALRAPLSIHGETLSMTASIGVAISANSRHARTLMRDADAAMHRAKAAGSGRHAIADSELQARATAQQSLQAALAEALGDHQLRIVYQPCVDLVTEAMVAVEALLRWDHPTRGTLTPDAFLAVAESNDLIVSIGAWVIRQACQDAAGWRAEFGARAPELWINVSARQLGHQRLTDVIRRTCTRTGLDADQICIELTERQVISVGQAVKADLHSVRGLGTRLAIDDFGTGHTGLQYLSQLPITTLKIDRSFVAGLGEDLTATALTTAMASLGRSLDLRVVAEGVETDDQRAAVRALGCGLAQGWLFGRPAGAEAIRERIGAMV